jgi:osmotically-inducible protein OsmY
MATDRRSDLDITRDVSETLTWDTRIEDNLIQVVSNSGRVTLSGTVPQFSQKTAASEDAWRIKGVREVINDLVVSPPDLRTDREIADDVFASLRRDPRVDAPNIEVDVAGSMVRLSGVVRTQAEKRAAQEDAWYTYGVIDVANDLTVTPTGRRSDRDIEADVKAAVTRDARIDDPLRINVSVVNAVVFLRGAADSVAARQAAEEDARFTAGVVDVDNELALVPD